MNYTKDNQWMEFLREGYNQDNIIDIIFNKKKSLQFQHQYDFPSKEILIRDKKKWQFLSNKFKSENLSQKQNDIVGFYRDKKIVIDNVDRFLIKQNWKNDLNYMQLKKLWPIISNCNLRKEFQEVEFQNLKIKKKITKIIDQDIKRTTFYQKNYEQILRKLLQNFAKKNPQIEYVQGMNLIGLFLIGFDFNQEQTLLIFEHFLKDIYPLDFFQDLSNFVKIDIFILDLLIKNIFKKQQQILQIYQQQKDNIFNLIIHPLFITLFCNKLVERRNFLQKIFHFVLLDGYTALYIIVVLLLKLFFQQLQNFDFQQKNIHQQFFDFLQLPELDSQLEQLYNNTFVNFYLLEQLRKKRACENLNRSEFYIDMNQCIKQLQCQQYDIDIDYQYKKEMKIEKNQLMNYVDKSKQLDQTSFLMSSMIKEQKDQDISYFDMSCSYILPPEDTNQTFSQSKSVINIQTKQQLEIHECFKDKNDEKIKNLEFHKCNNAHEFYQDEQKFIKDFMSQSLLRQKAFSHYQKKQKPENQEQQIEESYIEESEKIVSIIEQSCNTIQILQGN